MLSRQQKKLKIPNLEKIYLSLNLTLISWLYLLHPTRIYHLRKETSKDYIYGAENLDNKYTVCLQKIVKKRRSLKIYLGCHTNLSKLEDDGLHFLGAV